MKPEHRKPSSIREALDEEARLASERTTQERTSHPPIERRPEASEPIAHATARHAEGRELGHELFPSEETTGYHSRWEAIQTGFVDEPRAAVEQADALVAQVVSRLSEVFTRERQNLEEQWGRGDNVSTEDLRIALKRYRSFFDRLLTL
jgi:hypothetical protein